MNYKSMCAALVDNWDTSVAIRYTNENTFKICYNPIMDQLFIKTQFGWELFNPSDNDCSATNWIIIKNV